MRAPPSVYLALSFQTLISAGTFLVAKGGMNLVHPADLLIARFIASAAVFAGLLWVTPGTAWPPRRDWGQVALLGFLAGPLNQGFLFFGLSRSVPSHAALLYALTPLGVFLYGLFRRRERASPTIVAGIAIAFSGVLVLLLGRGLAAASGPLIGDLLILVAVVAWVLYTAEGASLIRQHGPLRASAWTMIAGTLFIAPVSFFVFNPRAILDAGYPVYLAVLYLAVMTSVTSYLLWYFALGKLQPSKVAIFSNLQPVVTALAAWLFLKDPLTWEMAAGGSLVLVGVRLVQTG